MCLRGRHADSVTHFSLKPPPTPVPLPETLTVASWKVHDAAASTLVLSDNRGSTTAWANLISAVRKQVGC